MRVGAGHPASSEGKPDRYGTIVQSGFAGSGDRGDGKRNVGAQGCGSVRGRRLDGNQMARASARQRRALGTPARRPPGSKLDPHRDFLLAAVEAEPDSTLGELQRRLVEERGVRAGIGTIWTFLDRYDLTFKKKSAYAAEQNRPDVREEREDWFEGQLDLEPERLVFVDESFATTNMARRYGRAPRGVRLRAPIPHGNRKKTTLVAGLRLSGVTATQMLDGSINGERFLEYVKEVLVPTLAPSDLVVIDNLSSHKSHPVREAIEAAGAKLLFLPRYSPDFSPIEKAFAKLKALLRKPAERTVSGVRQAIQRILAGITPTECANFFASAGHDPI